MSEELKVQRTREQWAKCEPKLMAQQSQAAIMYALQDARRDIESLYRQADQLRADLSHLKAGQGEAVAYRYKEGHASWENENPWVPTTLAHGAVLLERKELAANGAFKGDERDHYLALAVEPLYLAPPSDPGTVRVEQERDAAPQPGEKTQQAERQEPVTLTVWCGPMPESNGKSNYTAILHRKGQCISEGITIDRSEYPERVQYEADRMKYLIGETDTKPFILDYDADKHSGYTAPQPAQDVTGLVEALHAIAKGCDCAATTDALDELVTAYRAQQQAQQSVTTDVHSCELHTAIGGSCFLCGKQAKP